MTPSMMIIFSSTILYMTSCDSTAGAATTWMMMLAPHGLNLHSHRLQIYNIKSTTGA
jgi:hypothetical protein